MLSELLSLISQETRLLRLTTPLGDGVLTPECVRGAPLTAQTTAPGPALQQVIGSSLPNKEVAKPKSR